MGNRTLTTEPAAPPGWRAGERGHDVRVIGYHLSSEEHQPHDLVRYARRAEESGFGFAQISDHFHPWVNRQGSSPFVWGVLGAIAEATETIPVGTAVTCPTVRIHPVVVAHAAATAAALLDGRFFFGVGTGERLNEHVLGDPWPANSVRQEMLEEAVEVVRELWTGKLVTRRGRHYAVDNARLYTLPSQAPPIVVSATGEEAARTAAAIGDGVMSTKPDPDVVRAYREAGGGGPTYSMVHVLVHEDRDEALRLAREWWPNSVIPGAASTEFAVPEHYEPLGDVIPDQKFLDTYVLGADLEDHVAELQKHFDAGYERVAVHQIGPDQETCFRFYAEEVLPRVERVTVGAAR